MNNPSIEGTIYFAITFLCISLALWKLVDLTIYFFQHIGWNQGAR